MNTHVPNFGFDNSFAREMEGFFVPWDSEAAPDPEMLTLNGVLAAALGLDPQELTTSTAVAVACADALRPSRRVRRVVPAAPPPPRCACCKKMCVFLFHTF